MSNGVEFGARPGMTDEVLYARDGCLGRIMLNRPKVINALTSQMVTSVLAQLEDWAQDDTVATVSIQGAGERGLCSGGRCPGAALQPRAGLCGRGAVLGA